MVQKTSSRPIPLLTLLATHHRPLAWQLTTGISLLMLAGSMLLTGGQTLALLLGLGGGAVLGLGVRNLLPVLQHDLPLLREGVPVLARVVAPVSRDEGKALYHISYRMPAERTERNGVFVTSAPRNFDQGEHLLVMVNRNDPGQLLEITGQYEQLMHPVLEKEYA